MEEKRPVGRPKGTTGAYKDVIRSEKIMFRITPKQKEELLKGAIERGMTLSNYIVLKLFGKM